MADSDSVESSTSGAECDGRLRGVGKDVTHHRGMSGDKQSPSKSKSAAATGLPQIGASYLVRRHDETCRKC